jgi:uncharacterized BrkB/YihY/UPF0761 family membrane protein
MMTGDNVSYVCKVVNSIINNTNNNSRNSVAVIFSVCLCAVHYVRVRMFA